MRRHGLSLRRRTTVAQIDPEYFIEKLVAYVMQARRLSKLFSYQPWNFLSSLFNMMVMM